MKTQLIISLKILGIMVLLLGIVYPLFITGVAQVFFREKANGSLIVENGKVKGSSLLAQPFNEPLYFSSRPSATNYSTLPSGASNLGLTSKQLHDTVAERKKSFIANNNLAENTLIPSEMVFASASGLDPHISPKAAILQADRIAAARGFSEKQKQQLNVLIQESIKKPQFGIFGKPTINVLQLNLKLDGI